MGNQHKPTLCTDDEFIAIWRRLGSPQAVASEIGAKSLRGVYTRRQNIEKRRGIVLASVDDQTGRLPVEGSLPRKGIRALADITGTVMVGSDLHCRPGYKSVAHKAFCLLAKELKPVMVDLNGDLLDAARLCRQDPIGWDQSSAPTIKEEIEAVQDDANDIAIAAGNGCLKIRKIGNHDIRFERYLAMNAPQVEGLPGTSLDYYLPLWEAAWSLMVNGHTMIKHRFNNGVHAAYNNTLRAGTNIVTGHLHRLCVTPWGDYRGRRWGVDTGTMADMGPEAPQFFYTEDNPVSGCSGFAVLTFDKRGVLLPPELCEVLDGKAYFRGAEV